VSEPPTDRALPADDVQREALHNEVHARPPARIRLPARVVCVAVLNDGVTREAEWEQLARLPGQRQLGLAELQPNFLRLRVGSDTVKWERHGEFTRYSIVQPLPAGLGPDARPSGLSRAQPVDAHWWRAIPGRTVAAITFGGRSAPRSRIDGDLSCDRNVIYTFHIDREVGGNFDNVPDVQVHARFARNARGECGIQLENVPGAGTVSGPIETVNEAGGIKFFAGARNDPFFFDAEGYTALVASFAAPGQSGDIAGAFRLGQPRRDSFAARNVSAIVFEMDNGALTAGGSSRVRVWATTGRIAG